MPYLGSTEAPTSFNRKNISTFLSEYTRLYRRLNYNTKTTTALLDNYAIDSIRDKVREIYKSGPI